MFYLKHAAVLAAILGGAAGAGTLVVGRREALPVRAALGLVVWGEVLFAQAAVGWLNGWTAGGLFAASMAGLVRVRVRAWWVIAAAAPLFVMALHPPLAFDETLYHLPFVRSLAETGQLRFLAALRFPAFPQFHELLCVPVYLLAGDTATHLVALAEVLMAIGIVALWAKRYDVRAAPLAAALLIGSPIVVHLGTVLYVDAALMLFVAAGFYCLDAAPCHPERGAEPVASASSPTHAGPSLDARDDNPYGGARMHILAAVFFGAACSVKYLGAYFAVAALVIVLVRQRREAIVFAGVAGLTALPTYLWITLTTGNPVFPAATGIFGANAWTLPPDLLSPARFAMPLRVAWDVTFARERVNQQPPVTPLLIAMLLLVAAAALRDWRARAVVLLSGGYLVVFGWLPQDTRYLLPLLPLFCVGAAIIVTRRWPRIVALVTAIAILPGLAYAGYRIVKDGLPPTTPAARQEALARRLPGYTALQRAGKARVYVYREERLQYYGRGAVLGDFFGPHSYARVVDSAQDPATLAANLHSLKVDYFLTRKGLGVPRRNTGGLTLVYEDATIQLWRVQPALPR